LKEPVQVKPNRDVFLTPATREKKAELLDFARGTVYGFNNEATPVRLRGWEFVTRALSPSNVGEVADALHRFFHITTGYVAHFDLLTMGHASLKKAIVQIKLTWELLDILKYLRG